MLSCSMMGLFVEEMPLCLYGFKSDKKARRKRESKNHYLC